MTQARPTGFEAFLILFLLVGLDDCVSVSPHVRCVTAPVIPNGPLNQA